MTFYKLNPKRDSLTMIQQQFVLEFLNVPAHLTLDHCLFAKKMKTALLVLLFLAGYAIAINTIDTMAVDPSGVVMIAYTPNFAANEGDIVEYAALVTPDDDSESPLMLNMHQASCCKDIDGKCHDWHQAFGPKSVTCHGLNIAVDYKASVLARVANSSTVPVVIASKRVVAVSKDVVTLNEAEYVDLVNHVVEATANDEEASGTKRFLLRPLPIAIILTAAIFLFLFTFVLLRCVARLRARCSSKEPVLPQYEPILNDYNPLEN